MGMLLLFECDILKIRSKEENTHCCDLYTFYELKCLPIKSIKKPSLMTQQSARIWLVRKWTKDIRILTRIPIFLWQGQHGDRMQTEKRSPKETSRRWLPTSWGENSPRTNWTKTLNLDFLPGEPWRKKLLWLKLLAPLWSFLAVLGDQYDASIPRFRL